MQLQSLLTPDRRCRPAAGDPTQTQAPPTSTTGAPFLQRCGSVAADAPSGGPTQLTMSVIQGGVLPSAHRGGAQRQGEQEDKASLVDVSPGFMQREFGSVRELSTLAGSAEPI